MSGDAIRTLRATCKRVMKPAHSFWKGLTLEPDQGAKFEQALRPFLDSPSHDTPNLIRADPQSIIEVFSALDTVFQHTWHEEGIDSARMDAMSLLALYLHEIVGVEEVGPDLVVARAKDHGQYDLPALAGYFRLDPASDRTPSWMLFELLWEYAKTVCEDSTKTTGHALLDSIWELRSSSPEQSTLTTRIVQFPIARNQLRAVFQDAELSSWEWTTAEFLDQCSKHADQQVEAYKGMRTILRG